MKGHKPVDYQQIGKKETDIKGKFIKSIFHNNEGFVIGVFRRTDGVEFIAKGTIIPFTVKQPMVLTGVWENHSKYGEQLRITNYTASMPEEKDAVLAFLSSGMIPGIGKATAKKLMNYLGSDVIKIIQENPRQLNNVPGIGKKTAAKIINGLRDSKEEQEIMLFLMGNGITANTASKIYRKFGGETVEKIKDNPYSLATVNGVGFPTADTIAQNMGCEKTDERRLKVGIEYFLRKFCYDNGHVFSTKKQLLAICSYNLDVAEKNLETILAKLVISGKLVQDDQIIYLKGFYDTESAIAHTVTQTNSKMYNYEHFYTSIVQVEQESDITLTPQQREAIWTALNAKLSVMTGGPGVGKTLTIRFLLRMLQDYGKKPICAAPTGRAAKRINELTGFPAYTIHRLLGLQVSDDEEKNDDFSTVGRPLPEFMKSNIVIIDEASMIDMGLMKSVLDYLGNRQLVLVGDVDQLPSVGPGKIFKDIIDSGVAETVVLDEVFRQARESKIIQSALAINRGEVPNLHCDGNFVFKGVNRDNEAIAELIDYLKNGVVELGFDPLRDVQILSPMKKGTCGINNLNSVIQEVLNPCYSPDEQIFLPSGVKYRMNDKVMQIVNNYNKGVYNGEWGFITSINFTTKTLMVDYQDKFVEYEFSEIGELTHAFAQTIHKVQGSEFSCVVMLLMDSHRNMLQRNLFYTGVTRASEYIYIIGTETAVQKSVDNNVPIHRNTRLKERIIVNKAQVKK